MGLSIHITTTTAAEPVVDHYKNIKKKRMYISCAFLLHFGMQKDT